MGSRLFHTKMLQYWTLYFLLPLGMVLLRTGPTHWRDVHYEVAVLGIMAFSVGKAPPQMIPLLAGVAPIYSMLWRRHWSVLRLSYLLGTVLFTTILSVYGYVDECVLVGTMLHALAFFGLHLSRWEFHHWTPNVIFVLSLVLGSLAVAFDHDRESVFALTLFAASLTLAVLSCPNERPLVAAPDLSQFVPGEDDSDNDDEERSPQ